MLGVILCGGQSTRMGTDKGMIQLHANTWAQTAVDKIAGLNLDVVVSVNAIQYMDYVTVFDESQLVKDNNELQLRGPLAGVLSVHLQYPEEDLFVLACDMPLMDTGILKQLLLMALKVPGAEAFVYTNEGEPEPLCAIYKASGLVKVTSLLQSGQLTRHSMKFMLQQINASFTKLEDRQKKNFRNFNAQAELNGL